MEEPHGLVLYCMVTTRIADVPHKIRLADADGNDSVSFAEFVNFFQKGFNPARPENVKRGKNKETGLKQATVEVEEETKNEK